MSRAWILCIHCVTLIWRVEYDFLYNISSSSIQRTCSSIPPPPIISVIVHAIYLLSRTRRFCPCRSSSLRLAGRTIHKNPLDSSMRIKRRYCYVTLLPQIQDETIKFARGPSQLQRCFELTCCVCSMIIVKNRFSLKLG